MKLPDEQLSNEEINSLLKKYKKTGDVDVRDKIIFSNLRLVYSIAHKYKRSAEVHGCSFEDLVSDGITGLIEAIDKFDMRKDVKFSTYAYWWVLKKITASLTVGTFELPYHRRRALRDYEKMMAEAIEKGIEFDPEKACKVIGVSKKIITDSMAKRDGSSYGYYVNRVWTDLLMSASSLENGIIDKILYEKIQHMIDHDLNEEERKIIVERYGLNGMAPRTLDEIANDLGISYEYVRTMQNKVIEKLYRFISRKRA